MNSNNKNSNNLIIIGIILIVISLVIFGGVYLLSSGQDDNKTTKEEDKTPSTVSSYTIKYNGFNFEIPIELIYTHQNDSLLLEDNTNMWMSYLEVIEGQYNKLLTNKNELQKLYEKQGYTSSNAINKTIGRTSFITLEVSKDGENILLGIANANNTYMFGVIIMNQDNEYDYEALNVLANIVNKAEYLGNSVNILGGNKLDLSVITDIAK